MQLQGQCKDQQELISSLSADLQNTMDEYGILSYQSRVVMFLAPVDYQILEEVEICVECCDVTGSGVLDRGMCYKWGFIGGDIETRGGPSPQLNKGLGAVGSRADP